MTKWSDKTKPEKTQVVAKVAVPILGADTLLAGYIHHPEAAICFGIAALGFAKVSGMLDRQPAIQPLKLNGNSL